MKVGFGYIALRCGCKFHERWHSFSQISLHSLTFLNDEGRTHMTNCYTDFFATLEEPPSESEGEDGEDLSSDEEQDL